MYLNTTTQANNRRKSIKKSKDGLEFEFLNQDPVFQSTWIDKKNEFS